MCIVAIAWQLFDEVPLVLLSNRDEFLARPTEQLHQWPDQPIYAGRDSQSGGTWLGIHQVMRDGLYEQNGRWAAVLNFRDGVQAGADERSRGALVTDFLTSDKSPMDFARQIELQDYAGFNLIIGDALQAVMVNNRGHAPTPLYAGLHVVSNGQPDDGWFKTEKLRGRLRQEVLPLIAEDSSPAYWQDAAYAVLSDNRQAPADQLPDTGMSREVEQMLSSVYIEPVAFDQRQAPLPTYGTRTQSILTLRQDKHKGASSKTAATLVSREASAAATGA
ncbi:NRDE family protein [Psychrobacter halodurans]|uniref:NRDE family protein n=1 Tax=Psychrobacter halodurans TaxID=2818439 RepID=A0AAW4IVS3_9GAMM|nr:NRDE family protein [Psychrobacter halodurans]MBO1516853.1 NRDE family protein [Psychrobacter halodurans]